MASMAAAGLQDGAFAICRASNEQAFSEPLQIRNARSSPGHTQLPNKFGRVVVHQQVSSRSESLCIGIPSFVA